MQEIINDLRKIDFRHQMRGDEHVFTVDGTKLWAILHIALVALHYRQSVKIYQALEIGFITISCSFIDEMGEQHLLAQINQLSGDLSLYRRDMDKFYSDIGERMGMKASEMEIEAFSKGLDRIAHLEKDERESKYYRALQDLLRQCCSVVGDQRRKLVERMSNQNKQARYYLDETDKMNSKRKEEVDVQEQLG